MSDQFEFELLAVRDLEPPLLDAMVSLLRRSFARWPAFDPGVGLADHLRWKMTSPSAALAAVLGRRGSGPTASPDEDSLASTLVASLTIVTQRVRVCGREVPRLRFVDQAVDPAWRGRGLSAAMNDFVQTAVRQERLRLTDRSSHPAMHRLRERQGARPFGNPVRPLLFPVRQPIGRRPPPPLRPRTPDGAVGSGAGVAPRSGRGRAIAAAMPLLARVAHRRRRRRGVGSRTLRVSAAARFDSRADDLWAANAERFDVMVARDASHLDWRYGDPRGGPSTILLAEEGADLVGWAVLKLHGARAHVADLLVRPEREDVIEALACAGLDRLEAAGASEVSCWLPARHPYRRALSRCGFLSLGAAVPLAYRWEGEGAIDDGLMARADTRIHFTVGDSDFV